MTRNQIVTELFMSKAFNECIGKMEPAHIRDDLKQEVALVVCSLPDEKLIGIHQRGELNFYVARVIINMANNREKHFYKNFRQFHYQLSECIDDDTPGVVIPAEPDPDFMEREMLEQVKDAAIESIDKLYWYDAELVRLYMRLGNFRALERETGIPFISCYHTIKKSFKKLKEIAHQSV